MEETLESIRYLADSEHRAVALRALLNAPQTQANLRAETGASTSTVSRLLCSFEERNWIERRGQQYVLTSLGKIVATEFLQLYERLQATERIERLVEFLPPAIITVGLEHLADARVTVPSRVEPFAPFERASTLQREATSARELSTIGPQGCLDAHREAVTAGRQTLNVVFTRPVIETAANTDDVGSLRTLVDADRASVAVSDSELPALLGLYDTTVCLVVTSDEGVPLALIETDDEAVFDWAETLFDTVQSDGTPLTRESIDRLQTNALS